MGRAGVRAAYQTYLQEANIPYLGTVYAARPTILSEDDYTQTLTGQAITESANGSSCVVVINIVGDKRERMADTGRGAVNDTNIHKMVLELFFASSSGDAVSAQQDYDAVVDALIITLRANPTPGGTAVVWSAGEYTAGVVHDQDEPFSSADGLTVLINGVIRYDAYEWVVGAGV